MKRISVISAVFAASLAASSASAQEYSAGLGLSTFGPTLEGSYSITPNLNVRGIGFIPLSASFDDIEVDDFTLDAKISTGAFAVMADYYPTGQGWRVSGGLFFAPNELLSGTFTETLAPANTFVGELNMENSVAPIITGGYQYDFDSGWYVSGELGAIISGFKASSPSAANAGDIADINAELDDYPVYPYIAVSVGFTF